MTRKFKLSLIAVILLCIPAFSVAQEEDQDNADAFFIRKIYDHSLTKGKSYDWLMYLSNRIGGRLSGSPQAAAAVEYTRQEMIQMGMDNVYLQECMVPHWIRGEKEIVRIVNSPSIGSMDLRALALGNSDGTGPKGLTAEVIEVQSLDEVDSLGEAVAGKIVFYNRPMDPTQLNTFYAYGGAVDQRGVGPARAAKYGAAAAVVRSMTMNLDDVPHTGATNFRPGDTRIPALAISTNDAELLSELLEKETVRLYLRNTSKMMDELTLSYNVIGEIKGSTYPDEIIVIGGHLDSWDIGKGTHDDGAGCVQAMDVINILKSVGYTPQRTIRSVMFMNEENGLKGALAYRDSSNAHKEYHMAAIESDRGGFTPRGFTFDADEAVFNTKFEQVLKWLPLLESYGLNFKKGGSGADVNPLKSQKGLLIGFEPDSQRYFDYHHAPTDRDDVVNKRELELGVAAITSLVYLLDKYGLK
ncbi:MAG: M28 family peptidase [Bacteroidota bacterium]